MCSLEVPDLEQSLRAAYAEDDVVVWLVNPEDPPDRAYGFLDGMGGVGVPALLDTGGALYNSYPRNEGESYAPFPVHVVIDQQGVIRYLAFQNDMDAMRRTIDGLLAE